MAANKRPARKAAEALRFAHPFIGQRDAMVAHIKGKLQKVPPVRGQAAMTLADVVGASGAQEIEQAGAITFHAAGDTGRGPDTPQALVAEAMAKDFAGKAPGDAPAFFLHLGDVCYGHDKIQSYRREFYEPYVHYPGKIIAIPGNHDGEVFPKSDAKSLEAFLANFCAPSQTVPPIAGTIYRQTMNQPGVYWFLDAPFVQIVGLYSNAAENPGFISGSVPGPAQLNWLTATLKRVKAQRGGGGPRKALVIATHHPPYTAGGHSPSPEMLKDIDDACQAAGVMCDAHLSGHAHSYQRYSRRLTFGGRTLDVPYIVAGTGGINDQAVPAASGQTTGNLTFVKSLKGYGYLTVRAQPGRLTITMMAVDQTSGTAGTFDSVEVPVA